LANEMARRGMNVLIVSRKELSLQQAAKKISIDNPNITVEYLATDCAAVSTAVEAIKDRLLEKKFTVLVNNVRFMSMRFPSEIT